MTGKLAELDITQVQTDTLLYSVPNSVTTTSFTICFVNRTTGPVKVRFAITSNTSVTASSYMAYDTIIYPNESYERSGLLAGVGQYVYVRTDTIGVNALMWGYEE